MGSFSWPLTQSDFYFSQAVPVGVPFETLPQISQASFALLVVFIDTHVRS